MNYTYDQRIKAIAPYIGCNTTDLNESFNFTCKDFLTITEGGFRLFLKPLSAISDDDAVTVARMAVGADESRNVVAEITYRSHRHILIFEKSSQQEVEIDFENADVYLNTKNPCQLPFNNIQIIDFLRSKGYDLPSYHLGGKTLIEAGLAIDSTKQKEEQK